MGQIHVTAERAIDAPVRVVYAVLSDYSGRHRDILPPRNFVDYRVERGGHGAGTAVSFRVRAGGRERPYRMRISEPDPGRVIQERDETSSLVTTFTCTPLHDGVATRVRVETAWDASSGIGGFFERTFAPGALRGIYYDELDRLAGEVASAHGSPAR